MCLETLSFLDEVCWKIGANLIVDCGNAGPISLSILCLNSCFSQSSSKHNWGAVGVFFILGWVFEYLFSLHPSALFYLLKPQQFEAQIIKKKKKKKTIVPNMKEVSCDRLWLPSWILSLRSGQTFPLRPNMVWLMWCKWGIWNTLAIQLYLALSHFHISCRTFNTSLLDEANAFFWPWHFKVPVVWKK